MTIDLPTYTLAEVLATGVCVHVDFVSRAVITWNEASTFNVFTEISELGEIPNFENNGSFFNNNATSGTAPGIAKAWLNGE